MSRKHFVKQLTRLERRQARIRAIRAQTGRPQNEETEVKPEVHHTIGVSQNHPVNVPLFLQKSAGDPAIKVSINIPHFHSWDL